MRGYAGRSKRSLRVVCVLGGYRCGCDRSQSRIESELLEETEHTPGSSVSINRERQTSDRKGNEG